MIFSENRSPLSRICGCFDAAAGLAVNETVEAEGEFGGQQCKADRQRPQQPPFREHQVLDGDRAQHRQLSIVILKP